VSVRISDFCGWEETMNIKFRGTRFPGTDLGQYIALLHVDVSLFAEA